ncbi:MAG: DUF2189 domain-containing protein [Azonexus sp.]
MNTSFDPVSQSDMAPDIRRVPPSRIVSWLQAGWRDVLANPIPSLAYGLLFGIGGDLILLASLGRPHLFTAALSGFFLLAPLLAVGLYELSRQHAAGAKPTFIDSLRAFRGNGRSIALFGLVLGTITLIWERASSIGFGLLGGTSGINVKQFISQAIANSDNSPFLILWFVLGGMLALATYALGVVSVPLMLDRNAHFVTAILTSFKAFATNTMTLLLWAATIVVLTLLGFATLLFGLVVIMPVLGHASWHAYRDLVE